MQGTLPETLQGVAYGACRVVSIVAQELDASWDVAKFAVMP